MQRLLPYHIKLLLIKSLVFPHFNYCNAVINDMTVALSNQLQRAQNYCIRFLFDLRWRDHVTPYFIQSSILKLADLRSIRILVLVYSILKTGLPIYLSENFQLLQGAGAGTRTGSFNLRIPIHRTTLYNKSFTVNACRLWNDLPKRIKQIESRERFVAELRKRFLDRMVAAGDGGALATVVE